MKFVLPKGHELEEPLRILLQELCHEYGEGGMEIIPEFTEEPALEVLRTGSRTVICCREKAHFFRGVGHLLAHLEEETFTKRETVWLDSLGSMLDCSRNAVPRVEMLKGYIRTMALLGMNELFLYMEDTYEIPEEPYFGAFRGRYTREELKECDRYGEMFGVELIPCIQTLAHLRTFLRWPKNQELQDNPENLMPEDEKTYALIDAMLKSLKETFHTKKIHLGMDEAHNLGLGAYLRKYGMKDRLAIMKQHLSKVEELCRKYDLSPMIWSDMYFNLASPDGTYYGVPESYEWKEEEKPGENITLVYWDYYHHDEATYERMLSLHKKLTDQIYFAGGGWTWNGIAPNYGKAFDSTRIALRTMKKQGIRKGFMTFWQDDGAESPHGAGILPLILFAEEGFLEEPKESDLEEKLELLGIGSLKDWMLLNEFDCLPGMDEENLEAANPSKQLLYQDPLLGLFDRQYQSHDFYRHYGKLAASLLEAEKRSGVFRDFFACYRTLAELLAVKGGLGVDIRRAYLEGDRDWLISIMEEQIPVCLENLEEWKEYREKLWFEENKPQGYEVLDIRLGGLHARLLSAQKRISEYLDGKIPEIPELLEERLPYVDRQKAGLMIPVSVNQWSYIVSAGSMTF